MQLQLTVLINALKATAINLTRNFIDTNASSTFSLTLSLLVLQKDETSGHTSDQPAIPFIWKGK